jgi:hypothetical protein
MRRWRRGEVGEDEDESENTAPHLIIHLLVQLLLTYTNWLMLTFL